jgi:hypothetical protein
VKLVIKGTPYDVNDAFKVPTINDMLRIVKVTGLSLADISTRFVEMAEAGDNAQVAGSTRLMEGFRAFVWLVRTAAGEKVTLDEANDFTWSDWHFDVEARGGSGRAGPYASAGPFRGGRRQPSGQVRRERDPYLEDIEEAFYSRLILVMRAFPGVTPNSLRDTALFDFRILAAFAESQAGG